MSKSGYRLLDEFHALGQQQPKAETQTGSMLAGFAIHFHLQYVCTVDGLQDVAGLDSSRFCLPHLLDLNQMQLFAQLSGHGILCLLITGDPGANPAQISLLFLVNHKMPSPAHQYATELGAHHNLT